MEFVARFQEETTQLDFKQKFRNDQRGWIDLAIDISALSNMYGGYLVYGVKDKSFELVGVSEDEANLIGNIELIGQKLGSYLDPPIQTIRSKIININAKIIGIICTQKSRSTHIFKRDAVITTVQDGNRRKKLVVQKGVIYVRTVTGNARLDNSSFNLLLERRLDDNRKRLLDSIVQVVNAPVDANITISESVPVGGSDIVLTDDPTAKSVRRIDVRLEPRELEEQVAAFHLLRGSRSDASMPLSLLWECYENRQAVIFSRDHKLLLVAYGIIADIPSFFWLQGANTRDIGKALRMAMEISSRQESFHNILTYGRLLPKRQFEALVRRVPEKRRSKLYKKILNYDSYTLDQLHYIPSQSPDEIELRLNQIAARARDDDRVEPPKQQRMNAAVYDWWLYAPHKQKPK